MKTDSLEFKQFKNLEVLFTFLFIILFISCKKDLTTPINVPDSPVSLAQRALKAHSRENVVKTSSDPLSKLERTIQWSSAFTKKTGQTTVVYAPMTFSQKVKISKGNAVETPLEQITYFVSSENMGKFSFYMVMKIPDETNSSTLIVNDFFYSKAPFFLTTGEKRKNTSIVNNSKTKLSGAVGTTGIVTAMTTCYTTSYTICAGEGPDASCGTTYTTTCVDEGGGGPIETLDPGTGGPGGGGGLPALPPDYNYSGDGAYDADNNTNSTGPKQLIPATITLKNGKTVAVTFGITASDSQNANKLVSTKLVTALVAALDKASVSVNITSIYIKATTNGDHSPTSNHYKGIAIDISRINGQYIANSGASPIVTALQNAFESVPNRRENFGPALKHKLGQPWTVGGHQDHIHFSVNGD